MEYTEDQISYFINLGKQLEYQRFEKAAYALQEAKEVIDRTREVIEKNRSLKELKHDLKEIRYNIKNKDPPIYLGNGKVKITIWKALPKDKGTRRRIKLLDYS
jgi:hypothetical protein